MTKVFVLPGIGGSTLKSPSGSTWGLTGAVRSIIDPDPLALTEPWEPTGLLADGVYLRHLWQLPQASRLFRDLAHDLKTTIGQPSWPDPTKAVNRAAQIVAVPYDFRQSNRESAKWLDDVIRAWSDDGEEVAVVAHSMGGLVASWWFTHMEGWQRCSRLMTVGTPHRGAPQALDWLANPVSLRQAAAAALTHPKRLADAARRKRVVDVVRTWPSMYELMPRYQMILDPGGRWLRPAELTGADAPFDGFEARADDAWTFHTALDEAWEQLPEARWGDVHCLVGTSHDTPSVAELTSDGLRIKKNVPPPGVSADHAGGDGTVPEVSTPIHHHVHPQAKHGWRHLPLWHSPETVSTITGWFQPHYDHLRGKSDTLVVDLDLPSEVDAGQTLRVRATVSADAALAPSDVMDLYIGLSPDARDTVVPLTRTDENVFEGAIRLDHPGMVSVQAVLGHDDRHVVDECDVAVLDPADADA